VLSLFYPQMSKESSPFQKEKTDVSSKRTWHFWANKWIQWLSPLHTAHLEMQKMEQALAESEKKRIELEQRCQNNAKIEQVVKIVPHGLFWKDTHGTFQGCNQAFAVLVGLKHPDEIVGKTNRDLQFKHGELEFYRKHDVDVLEGNQTVRHVITPFERSDGAHFWVDISKMPLRDAEGNPIGLLGVFDDITELRNAEEALKQSEAQYRALFSTMNEAVSLHEIICDSNGKPSDYRFLDVNPVFEEITGIPRSEWIGQTARKIYPEISSSLIELFGQVALTGQPARYEDYVKQQDRYYSVTAFCPKQGQFAIVSMDITEHRKAEELERIRRVKLDLLVEQSPLAVIEWDLDFRITEWNKAATRIFGFTRDEACGQKIQDLIFPQELRDAVTKTLQNLLNGTGGLESTYENVSKDGRRVLCAWHNTGLVDPSKENEGGVSIAMDVTEQKRLEDERKKLDVQMQQLQKLESLGVLAGGIAHDFNNLLTAILGNAALALTELDPNSQEHKHICEIEAASRRAADLCNQMLAYSGKGRFVVESQNINQLIEGMLDLLNSSISKKAVLHLKLAVEIPHVRADVTQLRQLIMNLVINAAEAINASNGIITISSGVMECGEKFLREEYYNENLAPGTYVWLEVSDNGCGIDENIQKRIFDPFFSTKFTGRGLGLPAVLGIVRRHKGALKFSSECGKGTTFKILFPALSNVEKKVSTELRTTKASVKTSNLGRIRILLVDDEEAIRVASRELMKRMGFDVVVAEDGVQALEIYKEQGNTISAIILDLTMPRMDGEETFLALKKINPNICVIISSGYKATDVSSQFEGQGLAGLLHKPYTQAEIAAVLKKVLGLGAE